MTRVYWWNTKKNLGDELTRLVLENAGLQVEWSQPEQADWVGIGSVLEWFNSTRAVVFGTGRAGVTAPPTNLLHAHVLALRGMYTYDHVRTFTNGLPVFGDPGLLVSDFSSEPMCSGYTAIVPHWQDRARMKAKYPHAAFVDVTGDTSTAITKIMDADRVVSSSLHGIVLADAFGIERQWEWFGGVQAEGFKFRDYGTVVGQFHPGEWNKPSETLIESVKSELRDVLTQGVKLYG